MTTLDVHNLKSLRRNTWRGRGRTIPFAGRVARVLSFVVLVGLGTVVGLYVRLTNPDRVRAMAVSFLSRGIEGKIEIGQARLSLFEGLQLRNVTVSAIGERSGATVFSAPLLEIHFSPSTLITGEITSAQVVATEPEVFLVEDVDRGRWLFEDLKRAPSTAPTTKTGQSRFTTPKLPEVLIRSGRVHRGQIIGDKYEPLATMRLEGQLLPREGEYQFNLQTRTDAGRAGPALQGEFSLATGAAQSSLTNVNLDFLETLLPARVRTFWTKLSPSGRVDVPVLQTTRDDQGKLGFQIELELNDVNMVVRPLDWASQREQFVLNNAPKLTEDLSSLPGTSLMQAAVAVQPKLRAGEVPLSNVQGRFIFTDKGVTLNRLNASIDGNRFMIHGSLASYDIGAPMSLQLESPHARPVELHAHVPYINALPAEIREVYYRFRPQGRSKIGFSLTREAIGAPLRVGGALEFANAQFVFQEFPYPVFGASGKLMIDNDPDLNEPRLVIDHIRGHGAVGGPNAQGELAVSGVITPLIGYSSVDVAVTGTNITGEPDLIAAIPKEARAIISEFDDDGDGPNPRFNGDFVCRVHREPGPISRWTYDTDVSIRNGYGSFKAFPYPLEEFSAELQIRKEFVRIVSAESKHNGGIITLSGLSEWGTRVNPNRKVGEPSTRTTLTLTAKNAPVDEALLRALPPEAREPLQRFGIAGRFDVTGPIGVTDPRKPPQFELAINARDATFAPIDWKTSLDRIEASMLLMPGALKIDRAIGRRGESAVAASGTIDWSDEPTLNLNVRADALEMDEGVRGSLTADGQTLWDSLKPQGSAGLGLELTGPASSPKWTARISPNKASLQPDFFPMPMTGLVGTIVASADRIELQDVEGQVAGGRAKVSGTGEFADRSVWSLNIESSGTVIDAAFQNALPEALKEILVDNGVTGRANLAINPLAWTRSPDNKSIDIIFDSKFDLQDFAWNVGLPFTSIHGSGALKGHFVDDDATDLNGSLDLKTFNVAGFAASAGHGSLVTDPATRRMRLRDLRAQLGQGDIAGDVTIDRSRRDFTKWAAELLLRNADVAKLTEGTNAQVSGMLNASLAVEGAWSTDGERVGPRRGRGEIAVTGEKLLKVPMIVGVTQVVSLSLPFTSGFNEATASYSIDDQRITFADIALKSSEMKIKGTGWLDLDQRNVSLDFYTASGRKRLPVIGQLLDAARKELFQIKVRGTISEPQISAGSFQTITTTVDEIIGGEKK